MHLFIVMKPNQKPSRIGRRADKQGSRPPEGNQSGIVKSATGMKSSKENDPHGHQNQDQPKPDPVVIPSKPKVSRQKWSVEDYKNVIRAYFTAQLQTSNKITQQTYDEWRKIVGVDFRSNIVPNRLANVRRDILNNKRLNDAQVEQVREEVRCAYPSSCCEDRSKVQGNLQPFVNVRNLNQDEISDLINKARNPGTEEVDFMVEDVEDEFDNQFIETNREAITEARDNIIREYSVVNSLNFVDRENLPKLQFNYKNTNRVRIYDFALKRILNEIDQSELDIHSLNDLIYATAKAATASVGVKIKKPSKKRNHHKAPKWKRKLQNEIDTLRAEISILDELSRGVSVKTRKARKLKRNLNITDKASLDCAKENLKQKMQLKAQRLRRFDKRTKFYRQNKIFSTDAKKFYREIGKGTIPVEEPPSQEELERFWNNIWGKEKKYNKEAAWVKREEERMADKEEQEWEIISVEEVRAALGKTQKWKSPGIDKIQNFWLNSLTSLHDLLTHHLNVLIENPEDIPDWLTEGVTYLLPKSEDTKNPKNYRPITCLTTMYKLLTSILTERMYVYLENNSILPNEQKGCKRNSYGCKDQLLIDRMILENCRTRGKNLSTAWIDYRKAFDSVPHDWILKTLDLYKVSPVISQFLTNAMKQWETRLFLSYQNGTVETRYLKIKRGIFQGDSLSPLLFCLSLVPLSHELNNADSGYKVYDRSINHLFYMDDLKLFAKNDRELEGLLTTVQQFSKDICMDFGLDKCAKATFVKGRIKKTSSISLDIDTTIRELDPEETYKYLGVNEGDGINHASMKERVRKEYYRRVRLLLKTELNSKNRIQAINTLAIPVVQYSFSILNWNISDLQRMDRKTRKLLCCNRMLHPKSDVDRLYLPRSKGGRGLLQVEQAYKVATIGMSKYLECSNDWMLELVYRHEDSKSSHSIIKEANKYARQWEINSEHDNIEGQPATKIAKSIKGKAKIAGRGRLEQTWSQKSLHGQYYHRSHQADVDVEATHQWLRGSGLKAETEGFIIAAQDQSLFTRNYQANIVKNGANPNCRFCNEHVESVDHLVSGCPILAPNEYVKRHDRVGQYLHWCICNHYGIETEASFWFEHHPPSVVESKHVTILWDFPINTDRTIKANRPDIVVKDRKEKTCLLIDMSIPTDKNVSLKMFDKLSKYKDLEIEIQKMWNLKTCTVPVVVGALGLIRKGTEEFISKIPGEPNLQEVQKIVLTSTAHILRKTLSM